MTQGTDTPRPDPRLQDGCNLHEDVTGCAAHTPAQPVLSGLDQLPPGPYRVEWPAEQGGLFRVFGRQGTPPDFNDGWAIPLVAIGTQPVMEWLAKQLNAAANEGLRDDILMFVPEYRPNETGTRPDAARRIRAALGADR